MLQKASTVGILQWVGGGKGRVAEDGDPGERAGKASFMEKAGLDLVLN